MELPWSSFTNGTSFGMRSCSGLSLLMKSTASRPNGMSELTVRNRQRQHPIDLRLLRQLALTLVAHALANRPYEIGVHIVGAPAMAKLNRTHLGHSGSTDVI